MYCSEMLKAVALKDLLLHMTCKALVQMIMIMLDCSASLILHSHLNQSHAAALSELLEEADTRGLGRNTAYNVPSASSEQSSAS